MEQGSFGRREMIRHKLSVDEMLTAYVEKLRLLGDHEQYDLKGLARMVVKDSGYATNGQEIFDVSALLYDVLITKAAQIAEALGEDASIDQGDVEKAALEELHVTKYQDVQVLAPEVARRRVQLKDRRMQADLKAAQAESKKQLDLALRLHQPAARITNRRTWRRHPRDTDVA
jgi:hypothetical protein